MVTNNVIWLVHSAVRIFLSLSPDTATLSWVAKCILSYVTIFHNCISFDWYGSISKQDFGLDLKPINNLITIGSLYGRVVSSVGETERSDWFLGNPWPPFFNFFINNRRKNGEKRVSETISSFQRSKQRYLYELKYSFNLSKDNEFDKSRIVLPSAEYKCKYMALKMKTFQLWFDA